MSSALTAKPLVAATIAANPAGVTLHATAAFVCFTTIAVDLLINLPVKKVITLDSEEGAVNLLTIY